MNVGYLGPPPTFSGIAARQIHPDLPCLSFEHESDILSALRAGEIDEGVLPLENQVGGYVPNTLDLIVESEDLYVIGEHSLVVSFSLYSAQQDCGPVRRIIAHPVALLQCRGLISRLSVPTEAVSSNGAAVLRVLDGRSAGEAALGPPGLELHMPLRLEQAGVEDGPNRFTRFARCALGGRDTLMSRAILAIRPEPDLLGKALVAIATHGRIDRVCPRATGEQLGDYRYLVELGDPMVDRETLSRQIARWRGRVAGSW